MNYYYADASFNPVGPITEEQLHELYRAGKINSNTAILEDGKTQQSDWKPFNHIVPLAVAAPAGTIYKADASVVSDAKFAKAYGAVNKPVKVAQLPVASEHYTLAPPPKLTSTDVVKTSKRYKDGYACADSIIFFGSLITFMAFMAYAACVILILISGAAGVGCLLASPICLISGFIAHAIGIITAATGQLLLATLDTAVNTTKHENL